MPVSVPESHLSRLKCMKTAQVRVLAAVIVRVAFGLFTGFALFPAAAEAHLDANLVGVPPSAPAEWEYHGISAEESKRWIREGIIFAAWAAQWRDEGFSAETAGAWHRIANVYTAGGFLKNGFSPEEAGEWIDQGIKSGLRAREYLAAGIEAREAGTFWRKGLYPDEVKEWRNAGFDAESMRAWRNGPRVSRFYFTRDSAFSQAVYDVEFARSWRNAGFTAEEAQRAGIYRFELAEAKSWRDAGFSFTEMVRWRDSGFHLDEAVASRGAGLSAAAAELRRYDASAREDERTQFSADITVKGDGTLDIVETVTIIDRPGGAYRTGYYKELQPQACTTSGSARIFADPRMQVRSVELDGRSGEHVLTEGGLLFQQNGAPLPEGEHRLTLAYTTDRVVLDEPHHDELCIVIAGTVRPGDYLRNASATVRLPPGAHVIFAGGNAGLPERKDFVWEIEETGQGDIVRYAVTRPLRESMAFSVNLGFVKGYTRATRLQEFVFLDRKSGRFLSSLLVFLSGLAVSLFYYLLVWFRVGRDPKGQGGAPTEFSPPGDIEPAGMRAYLGKGKTDHLSVAALLLSLAQRGIITISEANGTYTMEKTGSVLPPLAESEEGFLTELFRDGNTVILTGRPVKTQLARAGRWLKAFWRSEYGKQTERNSRYLWPGIIISLLFLGTSLAMIDSRELIERGEAGLVLSGYAAFLAAGFGLLALLFARLFRRPSKESVHLLERFRAYSDFLRRSFTDAPGRTFLPPLLQEHLPYAIAAGIGCDDLMIRNTEAKWYRGSSGGFSCADFSRTVQRAW